MSRHSANAPRATYSRVIAPARASKAATIAASGHELRHQRTKKRQAITERVERPDQRSGGIGSSRRRKVLVKSFAIRL